MVSELLNFINKHPKTILVAFFSIIVVGSVGGGIWINTLEARANSVDTRINLIKERHKKSSLVMEHQNKSLTRQISTLKTEVFEITSTVDELLAEVKAATKQQDKFELISQKIGLLESNSNKLKASALRAEDIDEISSALSLSFLANRLQRERLSNYSEPNFSDLSYNDKKEVIMYFLQHGIIGYLVISIIFLLFKRVIRIIGKIRNDSKDIDGSDKKNNQEV